MNISRTLRTPFFILAVAALCAAIALEVGSNWLLLTHQQSGASSAVQSQLGIPSLWLLDASLLWTLVLMCFSLVLNKNLVARTQGIISLIISIVIVLFGIKVLFTSLTLLLVMVGLISSFFGFIVYMALFGFFDTSSAAVVLSAVTFFKLVCAVLLVLAQQGFLNLRGLIFLFALSLLCDLLLSFLQGLPPGFLVSVTDAIGAIIISIIAIIYAIFQAIWAIVAIVRAVV